LLGPRRLGGILPVLHHGSRTSVACLEQGQVTQHLARAEDDLRPQGLGQLAAGPGTLLAQQIGEPFGHALAALLVGWRTRTLRLQAGDATLPIALEDGAGCMRVTAEMACDSWRRPAGGGQEDHLQAVAGGVGQFGMPQTVKLVAARVVELDSDHVTLYA